MLQSYIPRRHLTKYRRKRCPPPSVPTALQVVPHLTIGQLKLIFKCRTPDFSKYCSECFSIITLLHCMLLCRYISVYFILLNSAVLTAVFSDLNVYFSNLNARGEYLVAAVMFLLLHYTCNSKQVLAVGTTAFYPLQNNI